MTSHQQAQLPPPAHRVVGVCFDLRRNVGDAAERAAHAIDGYLDKGAAADLVVALGAVERAEAILRRARAWLEPRIREHATRQVGK